MRPALLIPFVITTVACATGRGAIADDDGPPADARRISWMEIETQAADVASAWEVVQRLRPTMLRARSVSLRQRGGGPVSPVAYVDGVRLAELRLLQTVPRSAVFEIRFESPVDATTRWGIGHGSGAIHVVTRK